MNKSDLEKVCIYSLLAGTGDRIEKGAKTKKEIKQARKISKLGRRLFDSSGINVTTEELTMIYLKIEKAYPENENPQPCEVLSFLFLGVFEIFIFSDKPPLLDNALSIIIGAIKFYDPNLIKEYIHETAFKKFLIWRD